MKTLYWLGVFFFFFGCGPATLNDLRVQGEAETKKLAEELSAIENKEDLQRAVPSLKKRFNKLADLLVQTRQFPAEPSSPSYASEELFAQLGRLYEIPGGREIIESAQTEAIHRLR